MNRNNMIFTTCVGYEVPQLRPFVESCRKHFQGDIYAFGGRLSQNTLNYLHSFNITIIDIDPACYNLDQMMLGRFVCFNEFITSHKLSFDYCFFLDMRDVFFQSNVFDVVNDNIYIKAYSSDKTFCRDKTEQEWILKSYGQDVLDSLNNKRVLCAGTTLVSFDASQTYLKLMIEASKQFSAWYFGLDEAIHNVIIYKHMESKASIGINRLAEVQTMNLQERFSFNDNWEVTNDDGSVCPVLHQYDRHEVLRQLVYSISNQEDPILPEFYKMKKILGSRGRTAKQLIKLIVAKAREQ